MPKISEKELREGVLSVLSEIAPEIEPGSIQENAPLRDEVDLDSMDFFRFLVGLHERFKIEIPESDYGRLTSLAAIIAYVKEKTNGTGVS